MLFAAACNASANQPGLPLHEHMGYLALQREAVRLARGEQDPPRMWLIGYNGAPEDRPCVGSDDSIESRAACEHQFDSGGLLVEIGRGRQVSQDESQDAITGRATVRYAAFLREELGRLPAGHPLHRRYQRQLRHLQGHLGPVAPVSSHP